MDLSKLGFETYQQVMDATSDVGGNAVIALGGGDQVTVRGVTKAQLQSGDFIYATPVPMAAAASGPSFATTGWDDGLFAFAGTSGPLYATDVLDTGAFDGAQNMWADWHVGLQHHDIHLV